MTRNATIFQKKVWKYLKTIRRGKVKTYKDIAKAIGHPKAARAVANACSKNPHPIIIPCHRVIRSDKKMGGYSFYRGAKTKKRLLKLEGFSL